VGQAALRTITANPHVNDRTCGRRQRDEANDRITSTKITDIILIITCHHIVNHTDLS